MDHMKKESAKTALVFTGAFFFNFVFWNEKFALNALLFDGFLLSAIFYLYPAMRGRSYTWWILAGHIISAALLVIFNTVLAKTAFSVTLLLLVAFSQYQHRSAWFAAASALLNFVMAVPHLAGFFKNVKGNRLSLQGFSRPVRMLFIPMLIAAVFFLIYSFASKALTDITARALKAAGDWFGNIFNWVSGPRILFFLLGLVVTTALVTSVRNNYFSMADMRQTDKLRRRRRSLLKWKENPFSELLILLMGKRAPGMMAIKNENSTGIISLALLNGLLLLVNILDIKYVWLGYNFSSGNSLSAYVHEGAGLLILSILLAMLLLLFFFRGNLNFYKKNKWLRLGAYAWIFQNLVLVLSVCMRDYYYISHLGLAYKRIGLLFFLTMVLAGLLTLFIKIHFTRTNYYLLRLNAWFGIFLLLASAAADWDVTIARYNLARRESIELDLPFLLTLSDKTLPVLQEYPDILQEKKLHWYFNEAPGTSYSTAEYFEKRKQRFLEKQRSYTWLSWNAADANLTRQLNTAEHTLATINNY